MPVIKNEKTGKFQPSCTENDMEMFRDWIKSGTTRPDFLNNVMKLFNVSFDCASTWYYKAKRSL